MMRRSSSLVTISLDSLLEGLECPGKGLGNNGFTNNEVSPPLMGNSDDKVNRRNSFNGTETENNSHPETRERLFQRVSFDLPLPSPNILEMPEDGARTKFCVPCCTDMSNISLEWRIALSDFFKKKLDFIREKLQSECDRSFLQTYFLYASGCGVTPFHFDKNNRKVEWLKKIPYYLVNSLAVTDICIVTKIWLSDVVRAEADGTSEIGHYMKNAKNITQMMLRVSFILSMKYHRQKYEKAVQSIASSSFRKDLHKVQNCLAGLGICCTSFAIVVISSHYTIQYGFNKFLLDNAYYMRMFFGIHESHDLLEAEGEELSALSVLLGVIGWATNFAGGLISQIARDGILFAAITLGKSSQAFKYKQGKDDNARSEQTLQRFAELKTISKRINSAFKVILRMFLLANIFMLTLFVDEYFDPGIGKLFKIMKLINVVFVAIAFYYSNVAAKKGEKFLDWMMSKENRETLGLSQADTIVEALSPASTGLGRGSLYINDWSKKIIFYLKFKHILEFLKGMPNPNNFGGVVAAYFFGIVETRPKPDNNGNMNGTVVQMLFGNDSFSCYRN